MQCCAVRHRAVVRGHARPRQGSVGQNGAVRHRTGQCGAVRCNAGQNGAVRCSAVQGGEAEVIARQSRVKQGGMGRCTAETKNGPSAPVPDNSPQDCRDAQSVAFSCPKGHCTIDRDKRHIYSEWCTLWLHSMTRGAAQHEAQLSTAQCGRL